MFKYVYMGICVSIYIPKLCGYVIIYSVYLKSLYKCLEDGHTKH